MKNSLRFMLPIITASLVVGCGDKIMKPSVVLHER
jgi:hypothetical protein